MSIGYIDSSFLLSLVFEDINYEKSVEIWNNLDRSYSSLLLEIECRINLFKYSVRMKMDHTEYKAKEGVLDHLLFCINRKTVDNEISLEIRNNDRLKRARSLDSIHLATAFILNKLSDTGLLMCSYDKQMLQVAASFGVKIPDFTL